MNLERKDMNELEEIIATNISFAMRMWAEEKPEEKPREKVGFEDFAKHFVERRNRILNLYTKRTLDEVEAYISKHYIKRADVLEAINVEPCEPDCSDVRHAYHEGQWDLACSIEEKLIKGENNG